MRKYSCALVIGWMALSLPALRAADTTGAVQGTVLDPTGAAVPGVEVQLINEATKVAQTQKSAADGRFVFNIVPPGGYSLRATGPGFRPATVTGATVEVNRTTRVDVVLQVGPVTESIEITADVSRIDTVSAQVSTNVARRYLTELPSSSRNTLSFAELAPGVEVIGGSQVQNITGTFATVNGGRQGKNVFYLDGSDNTGSFRNSGLQFPNPEAVQEVNVTTSNTSAEFGKQPGGTFNVITKSGTNSLHGSAFYFFHNAAFNANSWSRNKSGSARPADVLKQGGGTAGGPIRKDKTFFFASYHIYNDEASGFQNTIKFPTPAMVRGDFSQFNRPLYDPDTGAPLPGAVIPQRLLDPVALKLLKWIPTVPNYGDRYVWSFTDPTRNNELLTKIDHNFNSRHALQFSWFKTWGHFDQAATAAGGNVPAFGPQVNKNRQNTIAARHTWIASPSVVVQNRFAMARLWADRYNANRGKSLADFGAKWPLLQEGMRSNQPNITITDGFKTPNGYLSLFVQYNFRFGSTLSWVRGKHNVKFGGEFQRDTVWQRNDTIGGDFLFDGRSASTPAGGRPLGLNVFGYSFADFMMGRAATFGMTGILDYNMSNWSDFFFVQDEWKITRRLTLTPGLRYELYTPATETNNRAAGFIFGHKSDLYPNAPLHLAFLGDRGIPAGFFPQDRNNLAPRLGFAYDLVGDGKNVLRGGFGYYYAYNSTQIKMWNAEGPPWRPSASGGETRGLVDPWGTSRTVVYSNPPKFTTDVANFPYPPKLNNIVGFDQDFRTPYSVQWNITAARQISGAVSIEAGYVGHRDFKLAQALGGNLPVWTDNASLSNLEARRPIAGYGPVHIQHSRARSWYDALQVAGDVRTNRGLLLRATYVWAKSLAIAGDDPTGYGVMPQTANPTNLDGEKAEGGLHHVFKLFYVYDLPLWRNTSHLAARALGGWQLSGNFNARTGSPFTVTLGEDWNYDSAAGDRPNLIAPVRYTSGSNDQRMARYFAPESFGLPAVRNTFGSLGRNTLWGPGSWGADLSLLKQFRLTESKRFQFRAEAYNFLNHNNLTNPNGNMRSSDFTKILNRSGNRTMQMALRFVF